MNERTNLHHLHFGDIVDVASQRVWPAAELRVAIEKRATQIAETGVRPGESVFIFRHGSPMFFVDLLACWRLDLCVIPLDNKVPSYVRVQWIENLSPSLVIETNGQLLKRTAFTAWAEGFALGLTSSGTTGSPRLTLHTFDALNTKLEVLRKHIPQTHTSETFCALPTHFGHGLICNSLFPWMHGGRLHIQDGFTPAVISRLGEYLAAHPITFLSSTPSLWTLLEQLGPLNSKHSLKRVHCASAPLDSQRAETMLNFAAQAELWNVYGLTEFLGWVSGAPFSEADRCGRVGAGWDARIEIDPANSEVRLAAPYMMTASRSLAANSEIQKHSAGQFWATSDVGHFAGKDLILNGRLDFQINKAGFKIQPEEVEAAASLVDGVAQAACLGIPDELWGQKVGLMVVLAAGAPQTPARIREALARALPAFKVPDFVRLVPDLPRTSRGKIDRKNLPEIWSARP